MDNIFRLWKEFVYQKKEGESVTLGTGWEEASLLDNLEDHPRVLL